MALDQQPNRQQILDLQFFYSGRDDACSSIFIVSLHNRTKKCMV
jgi:hypothetical protein